MPHNFHFASAHIRKFYLERGFRDDLISNNLNIMLVAVYAKNIELTPAIRSFVEEKIGSLAKFLEGNTENLEARVEVAKPSRHHKSGQVFYAEVNLKIGKKLLRAQAEHSDLYLAIDQARDETERQIKKLKGKLTDRGRRQGKARPIW